MNKKFVTIFVLVKEDFDINMTRTFINEISKETTTFVELLVVYTNNIVNRFIDELNVDLPMTIIKNHDDLPDLYNLGLGDTKYLIDSNSISEITRKNNHHFFIGRRANIIFS